jgi:hypothetical protein
LEFEQFVIFFGSFDNGKQAVPASEPFPESTKRDSVVPHLDLLGAADEPGRIPASLLSSTAIESTACDVSEALEGRNVLCLVRARR